MQPLLSIVNNSQFFAGWASLSHADVNNFQIQLDRDFAPKYFVSADLQLTRFPISPMVLTIQDYPDDGDPKGDAGYHGVSAAGIPFAKVFASIGLQNNLINTVVITHEILEMLANPFGRVKILYPGGQPFPWRLFDGEVCDPVAKQHYAIGNTDVADFVWPNFWTFGSSGPWDQTGAVFATVTAALGVPALRWINVALSS